MCKYKYLAPSPVTSQLTVMTVWFQRFLEIEGFQIQHKSHIGSLKWSNFLAPLQEFPFQYILLEENNSLIWTVLQVILIRSDDWELVKSCNSFILHLQKSKISCQQTTFNYNWAGSQDHVFFLLYKKLHQIIHLFSDPLLLVK